MRLATCRSSRSIDGKAQAEWSLDQLSLVEAAGRLCAEALLERERSLLSDPHISIVALTGTGNNAADTLVLLRSLLFRGLLRPDQVTLLRASSKESIPGSPCSQTLASLCRCGVSVLVWDGPDGESRRALEASSLILDGLCGTGLSTPLSSSTASLVAFVNALSHGPRVVSIDIPSGLCDEWEPAWPLVRAHLTLAIEPVKVALYKSAARPFSGEILPVQGVFPKALLEEAEGPSLTDFSAESRNIPPVRPEDYKHERGVLAVFAGGEGTSGASILAARGAGASGAGLIRLYVPPSILCLVAPGAGGIMVAADRGLSLSADSVCPDAVLAGPGWRVGEDHSGRLAELFDLERDGTALILDAGAVRLARGHRFSGRALLTPHPGEFAELTGCRKEQLESDADALVLEAAAALQAVIILKGHVLRVASPDGRLSLIDGMVPALATGGSGDVLAGIAAALCARAIRISRRNNRSFDPYPAACAAASLLIASGRELSVRSGFFDPLSLTGPLASLAGRAWLPGGAFHG